MEGGLPGGLQLEEGLHLRIATQDPSGGGRGLIVSAQATRQIVGTSIASTSPRLQQATTKPDVYM